MHLHVQTTSMACIAEIRTQSSTKSLKESGHTFLKFWQPLITISAWFNIYKKVSGKATHS